MANNAWINHVKSYQAKHPGMSYGDAMRSARPSYKKQAGRNPLLIKAAAEAAQSASKVLTGGLDLASQVAAQTAHRRDESGFYQDEGMQRARKRYNELVWRKTHGLNRWKTDPSFTKKDLQRISGLDKYLRWSYF
jgi:hypothetical protein